MYEYQCKDCGKPCALSEAEEQFFSRDGLHMPVRCRDCRKGRRMQEEGQTVYVTECASCGYPVHLPFRPKDGRYYRCIECYLKRLDEEKQ